MRRIFGYIFAIVALIVPEVASGQDRSYWEHFDHYTQDGAYYRVKTIELPGMDSQMLILRAADSQFRKAFGFESGLIRFGGRDTKVKCNSVKGHIRNYLQKDPKVLFEDVTYQLAFVCMDERIDVVLCHVIPGHIKFSGGNPWLYWWERLPGGIDAMPIRSFSNLNHNRKWQLALIRKMDQMFDEIVPEIKEYLLSHISRNEEIRFTES